MDGPNQIALALDVFYNSDGLAVYGEKSCWAASPSAPADLDKVYSSWAFLDGQGKTAVAMDEVYAYGELGGFGKKSCWAAAVLSAGPPDRVLPRVGLDGFGGKSFWTALLLTLGLPGGFGPQSEVALLPLASSQRATREQLVRHSGCSRSLQQGRMRRK